MKCRKPFFTRHELIRCCWYIAWLLLGWSCKKVAPVPEYVDLYPVKIGKNYGYINAQGDLVIPPKFYRVDYWFKNNRVIVETSPGRPAMIDPKGNVLFQDTTGFLYRDYQDGLIKFETADKKICFVDSLGKIRFCLSDSVIFAESVFSCGRLLVRLPGNVFAYLNTNGKEVYRFRRGFPGNYSEDLVRRSFDGRTCYYDKNGNRQFCVKGRGSDCQSEVMVITDQNRIFLVNKKGKRITDYLSYDNINTFYEGYALVTKNKQMGLLHATGKEVIKPQPDELTDFVDGFAFRLTVSGWKMININEEIIPVQKLEQVAFPGFIGKLAYVYTDSTWGYINQKGKLVWKSNSSPYLENWKK